MNFIKSHKEAIKSSIMVILLFVSFFILRKQIHAIDKDSLRTIVQSKSTIHLLLLLLFGVLAFNGSFVYDFYLSKDLKIEKYQIYRLAWICQSFSFFIGMFGLTGAYLRQDSYRKLNVEREQSIKMALTVTWSSMVGLFFLSILGLVPLYRMGKIIYIPGILLLFSLGFIYIFADNLSVKVLKKEIPYLKEYNQRKRVTLSLLSIFEWFLASLYFILCIRFFNHEIGFFTAALVYIISIIIGILSMIPGGFGSFDSSVILLFSYFKYPNVQVLPALLLFRLGYYLIPFLVGLVFLARDKLKNRQVFRDYNFYRMIRKVLSVLVLMAAVFLILSATTPPILERIKILKIFISREVIIFSKTFTIFTGLILAILSRGIYMGVRKTYYATVGILTLVSFFCLAKGLDYEEALLMLVIAALLVYNKKAFSSPSPTLNKQAILKVLIEGIIFLVIYIIAHNILGKIGLIRAGSKYSVDFLLEHWFLVLSFFLLSLLISLSFIFTKKYYHNQIAITEGKIQDFKNIRNQYTNTAYTQLFYMKDKDLFVNSKNNVMLLYRAYKNHVFVLGDPVGEKKDIPEALDEFSNRMIEEDRVVSFYQVTSTYMEEFVEAGFKFLKLGESAWIKLSEFTLEGKTNKNMRKTYNKIEQNNLVFRKLEKPHTKEILDELENISLSWLQGKKEMAYSLGAFNREYLNQCDIFILQDENNKIHAFANELEIKNSNVMTIDMMRYFPNEIDSIMEMLLLSIIFWAKDHDYQYFDLGIAPLSNVGARAYSPTKEKLIRIAYNYGNRVYGFVGLRRYKEKFKPLWKNVYLAYRDDSRLAEILFYLARVCHNVDEESQNKL